MRKGPEWSRELRGWAGNKKVWDRGRPRVLGGTFLLKVGVAKYIEVVRRGGLVCRHGRGVGNMPKGLTEWNGNLE